MKKIIKILSLSLFVFTSCDNKPGEGKSVSSSELTKIADISKPEYVCEFSDGRKVYRFQVGHVNDGFHVNNGFQPHWIYFISSGEVTINKLERQGKVQVNKVVAELPVE